MKKITVIASMLSMLFIASCDKNDDVQTVTGTGIKAPNTPVTLRYEFTASQTGTYDFQTVADTIIRAEEVNTNSYTKTIQFPGDHNGLDSASFTVFPPLDWVGTGIQSNVSMKIYVNNVVKASTTGVLYGVDRANGIRLVLP